MIGVRKKIYHNEPTTNYQPPQASMLHNEILHIIFLVFSSKKFQIFIKVEEPNNLTYIIQNTKPIKL